MEKFFGIALNDEVGMELLSKSEFSINYLLTPKKSDSNWIRVFISDRVKLQYFASSVDIVITQNDIIMVFNNPELGDHSPTMNSLSFVNEVSVWRESAVNPTTKNKLVITII